MAVLLQGMNYQKKSSFFQRNFILLVSEQGIAKLYCVSCYFTEHLASHACPFGRCYNADSVNTFSEVSCYKEAPVVPFYYPFLPISIPDVNLTSFYFSNQPSRVYCTDLDYFQISQNRGPAHKKNLALGPTKTRYGPGCDVSLCSWFAEGCNNNARQMYVITYWFPFPVLLYAFTPSFAVRSIHDMASLSVRALISRVKSALVKFVSLVSLYGDRRRGPPCCQARAPLPLPFTSIFGSE